MICNSIEEIALSLDISSNLQICLTNSSHPILTGVSQLKENVIETETFGKNFPTGLLKHMERDRC